MIILFSNKGDKFFSNMTKHGPTSFKARLKIKKKKKFKNVF
jgi:hypothetical protein